MEAPRPSDGYESHSESEYYDFESESEAETECDWRDPLEGGYYEDYGDIPLGAPLVTSTGVKKGNSIDSVGVDSKSSGQAYSGLSSATGGTGERDRNSEVYAWINEDVPDQDEGGSDTETETEEVYLDVGSVAYASEPEVDDEDDDDDVQSVIHASPGTKEPVGEHHDDLQHDCPLSSSGSEYSLGEDEDDWESEAMAEMDEDGYESDQTAILAPLPRQRLSTIADAYTRSNQSDPLDPSIPHEKTYEVSASPIPLSSPIPDFDFPVLSLEDLDSLRALAGDDVDSDDEDLHTPASSVALSPGLAPLETGGLQEVAPMPLSEAEFQRHKALLRRRLSKVKTNQETFFFSNLANLELLKGSLIGGTFPVVGGFLGDSTPLAGTLVEWSGKIREYMTEHPYLTALQVMSLVGAVLPESVCPVLFWALGFGRGGPIAGTLSGIWQSSFLGNVPSGSIFSAFQSAAMGGKGLGTVHQLVTKVALGMGVASGGIGVLQKELEAKEKDGEGGGATGDGKMKLDVRIEERELRTEEEEEEDEDEEDDGKEEEKRYDMWESFWW